MMKKLLMEYKESLKNTMFTEKVLVKKLNSLDKKKDTEKIKELENDLSVRRGMIRDLKYAIDWMTTAREPGTYQGIEHKKAYEHKSFPIEFFERIPETIQEEDKDDEMKSAALDFLFSDLTSTEKDIYLLIKGKNLSLRSAAGLLKSSRSSVSKRFKEADKKVLSRAKIIH
jgi:positive control factor